LPFGSEEMIIRSIKEKLWKLADEVEVFPGHGFFTTIKKEKENNFFKN